MENQRKLNKFRQWRSNKKTCQRCQEEKYKYENFCPYKEICINTRPKEQELKRINKKIYGKYQLIKKIFPETKVKNINYKNNRKNFWEL